VAAVVEIHLLLYYLDHPTCPFAFAVVVVQLVALLPSLVAAVLLLLLLQLEVEEVLLQALPSSSYAVVVEGLLNQS